MARPKLSMEYYGTGRRKTSVARVWLVPGNGDVIVNDKPHDEYFDLITQRHRPLEPLKLVDMVGDFDVVADVEGGGLSGQAGAIRLGVARALLEVDPELRKTLKDAGYLTRDPRMKERKKYGRKKARKSPQFSKR